MSSALGDASGGGSGRGLPTASDGIGGVAVVVGVVVEPENAAVGAEGRQGGGLRVGDATSPQLSAVLEESGSGPARPSLRLSAEVEEAKSED